MLKFLCFGVFVWALGTYYVGSLATLLGTHVKSNIT